MVHINHVFSLGWKDNALVQVIQNLATVTLAADGWMDRPKAQEVHGPPCLEHLRNSQRQLVSNQ